METDKNNCFVQIRIWVAIPVLIFIFAALAFSVGGYIQVSEQRTEDCKTSNEDRQALRDVISGFFQPLPINPNAPEETQEEVRQRNLRTQKAKEFALEKFRPRHCGD